MLGEKIIQIKMLNDCRQVKSHLEEVVVNVGPGLAKKLQELCGAGGFTKTEVDFISPSGSWGQFSFLFLTLHGERGPVLTLSLRQEFFGENLHIRAFVSR